MVNQVDITNAETFLKQTITESLPDFDLSESTPFYDLMVRSPANSTYLPELVRIKNEQENNITLSNTGLSSDAYNSLLANLLMTKKLGTNSAVIGKVIFKKRRKILISPADVYVINNINYRPVNPVFFGETDFTEIAQENSEARFSIDISLQSSDIGALTAVANDIAIVTPYNNDQDFVRAYTFFSSSVGNDLETNQEALARTTREYGTPILTNRRGISRVFSDKFGGLVQDMFVVGMAEQEQQRDVESVQIPKRVVRLVFSEKIHLTFNAADAPLYYNDNPNAKYKFLTNVNILSTDTDWIAVKDKWFVEREIELDDLFNPEAFQEDTGILVPYLIQTYPDSFILGVTKTETHGTTKIKYGGKTDILIRTPIERKSITLTVPVNITDNGNLMSLPQILMPILKIHSIKKIDQNTGNIGEDVGFEKKILDSKLSFSARDNFQVFFNNASLGGQQIELDVTHAPVVQVIENFVSENSTKEIAEDTLIKYFTPTFITINLPLQGGQESEASIKSSAVRYVNNIRSGNALEASIVIENVHNDIANVAKIIGGDIIIIAEQHMPHLSEPITQISNTEIVHSSDEELGVTPRKCCFITEDIFVNFIS
jgi:hypothetical protein